MKSVLFWLLLLGGGYLLYSLLFSSDDETPPPAAAGPAGDAETPAAGKPPALEVPKEPKANPPGTPAAGEPPAAPSEEPMDPAALAKAVAERPESDEARRLLFEQGMTERQAYEKLGRTAEGMRRANEARRLLTKALFAGSPAPAEQEKLRETLRRLSKELLFGPRAVEGVHFLYTPKSGDNFDRLCRSVFPKQGAKCGFGLILAINGMKDARSLRAGEAIRVPLGEARIVVRKSEYRLYFLLDDRVVEDFPIGIGRDDLTPEGEFTIDGKEREPDWWPRPGEKIPYGDPRNILGTRWMSFKDTPEYQGFGIHGTTHPESIGKSESSGCIRMRTDDVERLFDWTPVGATVTILR